VLRRIAVAIVLLIVLLLVAVPSWIATHRRDLAAPGDDDLAVRLSALAPGDDGFAYLASAAQRLEWPGPTETDERLHAIRKGEMSEPDWLARLAERNAPALEALGRAARAPAMQIPDQGLVETDELVEVLLAAQRLVKLAGAAPQATSAAGDRSGALEGAWLGLRLGQRLAAAEGGDLLSLMLATSLQSISLVDLERLVRRSVLDAEASRTLTARLESLRWSEAAWRDAWAGEYQRLKATLLAIEPRQEELLAVVEDGASPPWLWQLVPADYLWQPNRTLAKLAAQYRERQRRSAGPCHPTHESIPPEEGRNIRLLRALLSPNPLGGIMLEIATPNLDRFDLKRCHLETRIGLLQTLIAARARWHAEGGLPQRLDALVPEYLAAVPRDRFGGEPLRYSETRKVVYSVGEDFAEAAAPAPPSPTDASEPAISLAF
jgi:hypothetical protein